LSDDVVRMMNRFLLVYFFLFLKLPNVDTRI